MKHITRSQIQVSVLMFCLVGVGLVSYVMAAPPDGMVHDSTVVLESGLARILSGVVDEGAGVGYVGTEAGTVAKVRLDEAPLMLQQNRVSPDALITAQLDASQRVAYFGGGQTVVKVGLDDLAVRAVLTMTHMDARVMGITLDAVGEYAYVGTQSVNSTLPEPARLIQVRVADMVVVGEVELGAGRRVCAVQVYQGAVYVCTNATGAPAVSEIAQFNLPDLTHGETLAFAAGETLVRALTFDGRTGRMYLGLRTSGQSDRALAVQLPALTRAAEYEFSGGFIQDGDQWILDTQHEALYVRHWRQLIELRLADLSEVRVIESPALWSNVGLGALGGRLYAAFMRDSSVGGGEGIATFDRESGNLTNTALFGAEVNPQAGIVDSAYQRGYFAMNPYPVEPSIVEVRLPDMTRERKLDVPITYGQLDAAVLDASAHVGYFAGNNRLIRVDLASLRITGDLIVPANWVRKYGLALDLSGAYLYFSGYGNNWGRLVRVRLADFTVDATLDLPAEDWFPSALAVDGTYLYVGTDSYPAQVVRVRLADFTRVDALSLSAGEYSLNTAVLDPLAGMAYFGLGQQPGRVVRVRLSDFTRTGAVTFNTGEDFVVTSAIDPAVGRAFFGTSTGHVVQVNLDTFTRGGVVTLGNGASTYTLYSQTIDPMHGYMYMGLNTTDGLGAVGRVNYGMDIAVSGRLTPTQLVVGEALTYTLTVVNHGPNPARGVELTSRLPRAIAFTQASPGCTHVAGVVTCALGDLAVNQSVTLEISGVLQGGEAVADWLVNRVAVAGVEPDQDPASNSMQLVACETLCARYDAIFVPLVLNQR